ncbi:MAG TPA: hypothetical protein DHN33_07830 [Eubacteriaceae bacterium]|nr:hypothetical protein [Eubacteriaceae bacterium]
MKYKLIILDIDGTLNNRLHAVSKQNLQAIEEARKEGVIVTLATGRSFGNMRHVVQKTKVNHPVVTNDGAFIVSPQTEEVFFEKRIPREATVGIIDLFEKNRIRYMLHLDTYSLLNRKMNYAFFIKRLKWRAFFVGLNEKNSMVVKPHLDIKEQMGRKYNLPLKMSIMANELSPEKIEELRKRVVDRYGEVISLSYSGSGNFEVLPFGISKGHGIDFYADYYGFSPKEIVAIGDNYNDREMLQKAGLGIAMGNAGDDLKEIADQVTKSNEKNGVAHAIRKWVL